MNNSFASSLSISLFFLTLVTIIIVKIIIPQKFKKSVIIGPLLLLVVPFVFSNNIGGYSTYVSPIMSGLVLSMFIEKWIEWILFKTLGKESSKDENKSIISDFLGKKEEKREKNIEKEKIKDIEKNALIEEQKNRDLKRKKRLERRAKEKK